MSRHIHSAKNPRVRTGRLIGRPSSEKPGWVDSSNPCVDSSSIFPRTILPRVRTGRLNSGKSCLSQLTHSSRWLIPYFSLNQFTVGPNPSTQRSTQPWRMLCLSRLFPSLIRLNLFIAVDSTTLHAAEALLSAKFLSCQHNHNDSHTLH